MTIKVWTSTIKTLEKMGYKVRKHDPNMDPDAIGQLYALEYNGFLYSDWMSANELNHFAAGAWRAMHVFNIDPTPTKADDSKFHCDAASHACGGVCVECECEQHSSATVSTELDEAVDQFFDYLERIIIRDHKADAQ